MSREGPVIEGGGHSLGEEKFPKERGPFIERGNASQEKGHLLRQATVRRGRRPFVEEGDCQLLRKDRRPFVKGRNHSLKEESREGEAHSPKEGGHCSWRRPLSREEIVHQLMNVVGRKEGRTMNFCVGKFKSQHDHMMSEFQRTWLNCCT